MGGLRTELRGETHGTTAPRGWASVAWQSDYGQFSLVDSDDDSFRPPQHVTDEMEEAGLFVPPAGLVVHTDGRLQQHIRISIPMRTARRA